MMMRPKCTAICPGTIHAKPAISMIWAGLQLKCGWHHAGRFSGCSHLLIRLHRYFVRRRSRQHVRWRLVRPRWSFCRILRCWGTSGSTTPNTHGSSPSSLAKHHKIGASAQADRRPWASRVLPSSGARVSFFSFHRNLDQRARGGSQHGPPPQLTLIRPETHCAPGVFRIFQSVI